MIMNLASTLPATERREMPRHDNAVLSYIMWCQWKNSDNAVLSYIVWCQLENSDNAVLSYIVWCKCSLNCHYCLFLQPLLDNGKRRYQMTNFELISDRASTH